MLCVNLRLGLQSPLKMRQVSKGHNDKRLSHYRRREQIRFCFPLSQKNFHGSRTYIVNSHTHSRETTSCSTKPTAFRTQLRWFVLDNVVKDFCAQQAHRIKNTKCNARCQDRSRRRLCSFSQNGSLENRPLPWVVQRGRGIRPTQPVAP